MPSESLPAKEVHRRLLRAVTELVGRGGRRGLTAQRVAEFAGVPDEAFFEFFADADGALLAAHDAWVDAGLGKLEHLVGVSTAGGDQARTHAILVRIVGSVYGCLAERPHVARLCLVETPAVGRRGLIARERAIAQIRRALEAQTALARLPGPSELTIQMVAGGIYDTAQRYAHADEADQLTAISAEVAGIWTVVLLNRN